MNTFAYNSTGDDLLKAAESILQGSLQEAQKFVSKGIYTFDGKKIDGARSSKLFLQALDSDGFLHNLSWKEWSESNLKDTSADSTKKQFVDRLAKQIKMFNKKIDLNQFLNSGNINFIDTVNYIFKLDPNIKYTKASGLKEESLQEAVSKIDVEELLDAAAKMRKEFPQLRKGQSIMLTLHNMNPTMYSMAAAKHDAFTVDAKIPHLINFLDPKYYAESANLDEAVTSKEISQIKNEFDMELIPQSKWAKNYQTNVRKVKQLYGIPQGNGEYDDVYFVIYDDENKPYGVVDIEGTSMYAKFSDAKAGLKFALNSMEESLQEADDFYAEEMIKNQLQTIVRNSSECIDMIERGLKFPEWAQSKIAVAEDGIISVTEFMQSHSDGSKLEEAMGVDTAVALVGLATNLGILASGLAAPMIMNYLKKDPNFKQASKIVSTLANKDSEFKSLMKRVSDFEYKNSEEAKTARKKLRTYLQNNVDDSTFSALKGHLYKAAKTQGAAQID
jgi:hypothetical protein